MADSCRRAREATVRPLAAAPLSGTTMVSSGFGQRSGGLFRARAGRELRRGFDGAKAFRIRAKASGTMRDMSGDVPEDPPPLPVDSEHSPIELISSRNPVTFLCNGTA